MLNVGKIEEGFVLDHIKAGTSLSIYRHLQLDKLDCTVAIIKNARSNKMGKKDILKVECDVDMMDLDVLAFIDHNITVNIIKNGEIVEKKSRFIATVRPVHSEEEVLAFIEEVKKKYWDARHNCFAYVIGVTNPTLRCSDDGEPAGTAGKPMLDVLTGEGLHDTAVVVTRYFGGTLLGTGGLVRAYQGAVKEGLQASTVITKRLGYRYEIGTDYTGLGKIQYILGQRQISVQDTQYTDKVLMKVILPYDQEQCVVSEITEGTNGQAVIERGDSCYFAEDGKEILVFEE